MAGSTGHAGLGDLLAPGQPRRCPAPRPTAASQPNTRFWGHRGWTELVAGSFSPYQTNLLNMNPLRDTINALIDFDRGRACTDVDIFISATNVWSGEVEIFQRHELTVDHLMASACLPTVFQAVEIDGVPFWDGGYMGDPALFPLFYETTTEDILLVLLIP